MTSRERVKSTLNRQNPDRLPFNFWMDRGRMAEFDSLFGENFRVNHYGADVIETFPLVPWFPELAAGFETISDEVTTWIKAHPLSDGERLPLLSMPDMDNEDIYAIINSDRQTYPDKSLFALIPHPMELLLGFFGFENFLITLYDYEDEVLDILYRISEVQVRLAENCIKCGVDVIYLAGDICTTKCEIMSPDMLEKFCFKPAEPIIKRVHELGLKVLFHTDGHVHNILPLFVKYQVDGINPFQSNCNDKAFFHDNFADKLLLYGGIDNCFIIPDGTEDEIREHIRRNFSLLGQNAGYIASSHDIAYKVTVDQIDAMVDELKKCVY